MIIDTHIHIAQNTIFNKKEWNNSTIDIRTKYISEIIKAYKNKNIIALRDGGDGIFASVMARDIARKEGIVYRTPIFAICKKGHYGSFLGRAIGGIDDFKREFEVLKANKMDHLKIILTGIVNFDRLGDVGATAFSDGELEYMVKSAKEYGVPVMVHANGTEGVSAAIRAGVNTIEHGFFISDRELYNMAEKRIFWVPTISPFGNIIDARDNNFKDQFDRIREVFITQTENIIKAYEIGVRIGIGSDAGAYRVNHAVGVFDEIRHFQNIGFSEEIINELCMKNGSEILKI